MADLCPCCGGEIAVDEAGDDFRVDLNFNVVLHRGRTFRVEPAVAEILFALNAAPGRFLTHDALLEKLNGTFGDRDTNKNSVSAQLSRMAKLLPNKTFSVSTVWNSGRQLNLHPVRTQISSKGERVIARAAS